MILAEHALAPLQDVSDDRGSAYDRYGWTISGNWGDTLASAFFPPNFYEKSTGDIPVESFFSASSLHPTGLNVLMGDGAVRFIKDSISTWPFDPADGYPRGATTDPYGAWIQLPSRGVLRSIATRSGGEVLATESY